MPFELILNIKPKLATNLLFSKNVINLAIIYILYKFKTKIAIIYTIAKAKIRYNAIKNLIAIEIGNWVYLRLYYGYNLPGKLYKK